MSSISCFCTRNFKILKSPEAVLTEVEGHFLVGYWTRTAIHGYLTALVKVLVFGKSSEKKNWQKKTQQFIQQMICVAYKIHQEIHMSQALDVYEVELSNLCILLQKYCVLYFCSMIPHNLKIPRSKIVKTSVFHNFESIYQNKLLLNFPLICVKSPFRTICQLAANL